MNYAKAPSVKDEQAMSTDGISMRRKSSRPDTKKISFAEMALEASKNENAGRFGAAAALWLSARVLACNPANQKWTESRHLFCSYIHHLQGSYCQGDIPSCCQHNRCSE